MKKAIKLFIITLTLTSIISSAYVVAEEVMPKEVSVKIAPENVMAQEARMAQKFKWWPTDARPGPVMDKERGGYWWWPDVPGEMRPWGNRGYVYVRKIIFDYKADELPPPKAKELRPALLVKKIIRNVKVYFDYDKSALREDARPVLKKALNSLSHNPEASILITGNTDVRGSEAYNDKLGQARAMTVKDYMMENNVNEDRIKIISRGKLDALSPVTDLVGMQKDRNAQFMVAVVEELMIPYPEEQLPKEVQSIEENKYLAIEEKKIEGEIKVSTKEYVIQKNDSLWRIAKREYGDGNQWRRLYMFNKDRIKNPDRLKPGTKILIPIE